MTTIVENPSGTSKYVVIVGNLGCVQPDTGGDIPIARIKFEGTSPGDAAVTFRPIEGFDTVVGNSAKVYDSEIAPGTITLSVSEGGRCVTETVYGENSVQAEVLRGFRDTVLSKTPEGQALIKLYYYWSPVMVSLMRMDTHFKEEVKAMMDSVLPMIERLAEQLE
jgi:hypothetical protein